MLEAWTLSDAWVFAAIAGSAQSDSRREYTLSEVIANTDMINHAVPNEWC